MVTEKQTKKNVIEIHREMHAARLRKMKSFEGLSKKQVLDRVNTVHPSPQKTPSGKRSEQ
jgi:hypothetical protein